jgi:hypothetical protein
MENTHLSYLIIRVGPRAVLLVIKALLRKNKYLMKSKLCCCYISVDPETQVQQNGIFTDKLSFHRITIINQKMIKNITF